MNREKLLRVAVCALLFILAVAAYPVRYHPETRLRDTAFESLAVACSLADRGTFADPFYALKTGATAHLAPAYPAFLGMIVYLFGDGPRGAYALQWCATGFMAAQLALFPWVAKRMGMGYSPGILAACLWVAAGVPKFDLAESTPYGVLVLLLTGLSLPAGPGEPPFAKTFLLGVLWGVSLLFNPAGILVLLAWLVWTHFALRPSRERKLVLAILPLAVVAPWMARNYSALHHFVFVRDNLGLELAVSNNDCASYSFDISRSTGCFDSRHPNFSLHEAQQVVALGEVEYNEQRMREAFAWSRSHPWQFAKLTGERFSVFWFPSLGRYPWERDEDMPRRRLAITVLTILSVPGLILLWRRERPAAVWCLSWLLLFPPVYYITQYIERYRSPILWATFLPAAWLLAEAVRWIFRKPANNAGAAM